MREEGLMTTDLAGLFSQQRVEIRFKNNTLLRGLVVWQGMAKDRLVIQDALGTLHPVDKEEVAEVKPL